MAVDDQMEMAMNESGRKDPVSGNDVPMGSLPEEVRDDVPAMLSEGEYVVPADVLRFYGLKFFEDLRENAKMEITRMAEEGRIGGEPVAGPGPTAPTPDQPNGLDLSPDDMQQLESVLQASEGGAVGFNVGGSMQEQAQKSGLPAKEPNMNVPDDTDMLIDRIMGAVENNPSLQQKLAAKGVGFMEGGVVQGYALGGLSVEDAIKAQSKYATKRFNPFDPNWMLGMSASGLQDPLAGQMYGQMPKPVTAAQLQEDAGVIKPKEQPDGPDQDSPGPTFNKMSLQQQKNYYSNAQKMKNYKGPFSFVVNALGSFNSNFAEDQGFVPDGDGGKKGDPTVSTIGNNQGLGGEGSDGEDNTPDPTGGSTTGGGSKTGGTTGGGSKTGGGPGGGDGTGFDSSDNTFGMDGFSMGKGGFISRRKKT